MLLYSLQVHEWVLRNGPWLPHTYVCMHGTHVCMDMHSYVRMYIWEIHYFSVRLVLYTFKSLIIVSLYANQGIESEMELIHGIIFVLCPHSQN